MKLASSEKIQKSVAASRLGAQLVRRSHAGEQAVQAGEVGKLHAGGLDALRAQLQVAPASSIVPPGK